MRLQRLQEEKKRAAETPKKEPRSLVINGELITLVLFFLTIMTKNSVNSIDLQC